MSHLGRKTLHRDINRRLTFVFYLVIIIICFFLNSFGKQSTTRQSLRIVSNGDPVLVFGQVHAAIHGESFESGRNGARWIKHQRVTSERLSANQISRLFSRGASTSPPSVQVLTRKSTSSTSRSIAAARKRYSKYLLLIIYILYFIFIEPCCFQILNQF